MTEPRFRFLTKNYLESLGIFPSDRVVFEGHTYEIELPERVTYRLVASS